MVRERVTLVVSKRERHGDGETERANNRNKETEGWGMTEDEQSGSQRQMDKDGKKQVTAGDMLAETARQILQGILRERWRQEQRE